MNVAVARTAIANRVVPVAMLLAACSAPATLPTLAEAEAHEKRGEHELALRRYTEALETCKAIKNPRERARDCASAHLHRAELLVTMERFPLAISSYEAIETALPDNRTAAAEGLYRAGALRLRAGDEKGGYQQLWRCVTDFPNEQFAGDALRTVVTDGRRRNPEQLYRVLRPLATALADTTIADNVEFHMAELSAAELGNPQLSLAHYDRVWRDHPKSGLVDESLWRGADLAVGLDDAAGAVERLSQLLATREVAIGAGSYFSVWLDNSQLRLGQILRDELGDLSGAESAFRRLPEDYPVSILVDDALYELAFTQHRNQNQSGSCRTLARLRRDWPDSKYELELAPALRKLAACP